MYIGNVYNVYITNRTYI